MVEGVDHARSHLRPAAAAALALALGACTRPPLLLHREQQFAGEVEVAGDVEGRALRVRGRLTFRRPAPGFEGHLQLDRRQGEDAHNVTAIGERVVNAFTNGSPRAPTAEERDAVALLRRTVAWSGVTDETFQVVGEAAYRLPAAGVEVRILGVDRGDGIHR
jgi:hypothetical protein